MKKSLGVKIKFVSFIKYYDECLFEIIKNNYT